MGRWRPQAVAPVTRGRDQYLMPTSQSHQNTSSSSNSNNNSRLLLRGQARDLFFRRPLSTLLTSVKILILTKQRQPHITPLLDHSPQVHLFPHCPPPAPRRCSGVMASQLPLRSVQVSLSHILQSSNYAQLSLLPSSVHQIIIAMTSMTSLWFLLPLSGPGMKRIPTARARLHLRTDTGAGPCKVSSHRRASSHHGIMRGKMTVALRRLRPAIFGRHARNRPVCMSPGDQRPCSVRTRYRSHHAPRSQSRDKTPCQLCQLLLTRITTTCRPLRICPSLQRSRAPL
jgi:hypothetical protein